MSVEIYSGRVFLGRVTRHRGSYEARDAAGDRVGVYATEAAAVAELREHMFNREARQ